jgi:molybdopterin-synthase adenylyltransferase
MDTRFSPEYRERFLRNIGIMTEEDLGRIKSTSIAIGGLGMGGSIFINLVRMGFERFHVADPDTYDRTNINRQRMAKEPTVNQRKDASLIDEARAINPDVQIMSFPEGVQRENVARFLEGIDWVVDVIDVHAMVEKLALNQLAYERKIPVVSCVAVGFGAALVVFDQRGPSFGAVTGMRAELSPGDNLARFVRSIIPEIPDYMATQVRRAMRRETHIPFVVPGVEFAAAAATTEIVKQILGFGLRTVAPQGIYIDPVRLQIRQYDAQLE